MATLTSKGLRMSPGISFRLSVIGGTESKPVLAEEQCEETDEEPNLEQYEVENIKEIWWRVLCVNNTNGRTISPHSLIGPTGHLERASAWVHLVSAAVYLLYAIARLVVFSDAGQRNTLVTVNAFVSCVTFFVSTLYHVYSPSRAWSSVARIGDFSMIYASIAVSFTTGLSLVNIDNLFELPAQSILDVPLACSSVFAFFLFRRYQVGFYDTRHVFFANKCTFGIARATNCDLQHASLRTCTSLTLSLCWTLLIPQSRENCNQVAADVLLVTYVLGWLLLFVGMAIDNVFVYPDTYLEHNRRPYCLCYSSKAGFGGGWILNAHAIWHIFAFLSTVSNAFGLEFLYSSSLRS